MNKCSRRNGCIGYLKWLLIIGLIEDRGWVSYELIGFWLDIA